MCLGQLSSKEVPLGEVDFAAAQNISIVCSTKWSGFFFQRVPKKVVSRGLIAPVNVSSDSVAIFLKQLSGDGGVGPTDAHLVFRC